MDNYFFLMLHYVYLQGIHIVNDDTEDFPDVSHFFATDDVFASREEVEAWIRAIGKEQNMYFKNSRQKTRANGCKRLWFGCERGGVYKYDGELDEADRNLRGTKKIECPFEVIAVENTHGKWKVIIKKEKGKHNHQLSDYHQWHRSETAFTEKEFGMIKELSHANIKGKQILNAIKKENPENCSSLRQVQKSMC